jgi:hypothetical protein
MGECRQVMQRQHFVRHGKLASDVSDGRPPLDPDVADLASSDPVLTAYDEHHAIT